MQFHHYGMLKILEVTSAPEIYHHNSGIPEANLK